MGNLAFTEAVLESSEERSAQHFNSRHAATHRPLELVSKPWGQPVADEPFLLVFLSNLRAAILPRRLPPLELKSRPIAVADPLAVKRDPKSSMISFVMHAAILALMVWFVMQARKQIVAAPPVQITRLDIKPYIPITVPTPQPMGGGGGGGARQVVQASKGHLPPVAKTQITPVETLKIDHPRLAVAPTVAVPRQIKLPYNNKLPNFGDTQAPQIALVSQGVGTGGGFGQSRGGGIGAGHGAGVGPGNVGGYGGGVMSVGGGVTAPRVLHRVEPEFSDAARQNKYEGTVSLQLIVDPRGNPVNIRVVKHLGMGLDEKAIAAVRQYQFAPAMYQGRPVPVQIVVDVDFHLN